MSGFLIADAECDECLFSPNRIVDSKRMKDVLSDTQRRDTFFVCHKSTLNGLEVACAGWHERFTCNLSRIAERLGAVSFVDPATGLARAAPLAALPAPSRLRGKENE